MSKIKGKTEWYCLRLYRHFPRKTLTQNLSSHEKWARLRAKNEIGQISSETENLAILLFAFGEHEITPTKYITSKSYTPFWVELNFVTNTWMLLKLNSIDQKKESY